MVDTKICSHIMCSYVSFYHEHLDSAFESDDVHNNIRYTKISTEEAQTYVRSEIDRKPVENRAYFQDKSSDE